MANPFLKWLARLFVLCGIGLQLSTSHASVTNIVWYRLGEADPGAAPGVVVTNANDLIAGRDLKVSGSPFYTNAVSAGASNDVGSSLAVQFSGTGQYLNSSVFFGATNNFCIEAWVKPNTVSGTHVVAYNGDPTADGWGIYQNGTNYLAVFGGVGTFGGGRVAAGIWTHLALVRDSGAANLFVNGAGSLHPTNTGPHALAKGDPFSVGAFVGPPASSAFSGAIDEVRVFSFGAGEFSASKLLVNLQRVTTLTASDLALTSATLNGSANASALPTIGWFEWGTTTNYGNATDAQPLGNGTSTTNFSAALSNLTSGVTYQFHAAISNALGVSFGANAIVPIPLPPLVTNTNDSGPGSLRQVIIDTAPGGTVNFASNLVGVITLTSGVLAINKPLNIVGPGSKILSISSGTAGTIMELTGGDMSLSGLTFVKGIPAIDNGVNLTLDACAFTSNQGIAVKHNSNNLVVLDCVFLENNNALTVASGAAASITNCTFFANDFNYGGAISNGGALTLISCTMMFNGVGGTGGGIYSVGTCSIGNSVMAKNTGFPGGVYTPQDLVGPFTSLGYNFIGAINGATGFINGVNHDQVGTAASPIDPLVNTLADAYNGGPTICLMPNYNSPLIDRGYSFGSATDQRGYLRPLDFAQITNAAGGDGSDIGAVEVGSIPPCTGDCSQVTVDTSRILRAEDDRWFGANAASWNGSFDTTTNVTLMTEMGLRTLRYPGGSLADSYHWSSNYWISNSTGPTAFTNFLHLATNIGANVFITVNYGSGTTNEAADWVRFANITNHCGFKYWEIGNECYSSVETDINTNPPFQAQDPWTYATRFRDYYNAMKAADPTIKIGAVVTPGEDSISLHPEHIVQNPRTSLSHFGWTPVMLATLKSNGITPDFLIHHFYPESEIESDPLLLQAPGNWAWDAADLRQEITDYFGDGGTNIELVCTENNSDASYSQGKQSTSLVNALYLADSMSQIMKTEFNSWLWWLYESGSDKKGSFSTSLYGWRTNGDFGLVLASTNRYPTFYAFKLMHYFTHSGDAILNVVSGDPFVTVNASQQTNGTLNILVINKDRTNTAIKTINLAGFSPDANATIRSYGIPQDEATRTNAPFAKRDIATSQMVVSHGSFGYSFGPYSMTLFSLAPSGPPLTVSRPASDTVVVSWPYPSTGWNLEQSTDLVSGPWISPSATIQNDGTNNFINISPAADNLFFRLNKP